MLSLSQLPTRADPLGGERGRCPQTAADQKIEMPAWVIKPTVDRRGDARPIGFVTRFSSVLYLLITYLDSGFSCSYFLSLING